MVGVAGCYNGLLLWPRGHSKLHPPPQVCCVEEAIYGVGMSGGHVAPMVLLGCL